MTKNQRLTFVVARRCGSKVQKFNFGSTLSGSMSACQYLPMDFYCVSETPPWDTVDIFCYKATNFSFLRKVVVLKNP